MSPKLSPKEKKRLERCLKNVEKLAKLHHKITPTYDFIMRQQTKVILKLLGVRDPQKRLIAEAIVVLRNPYPFKKYQLRKLIKNG